MLYSKEEGHLARKSSAQERTMCELSCQCRLRRLYGSPREKVWLAHYRAREFECKCGGCGEAKRLKGQSANEQAELCDTSHPILTFLHHHSPEDAPASGHGNRVSQRLLKYPAIAAEASINARLPSTTSRRPPPTP